jgi:hypothetical protein
VFAARNRALLLTVLGVCALVASAQAPAQAPQPAITLLSPGNGTLVEGAVAFRWRIDSATPTAYGAVSVTHQVATDQTFTQGLVTTTRNCPAGNMNCWTTFRPNRSHAGRHYWRVSVSGAATAASRTWMYLGVATRATPDRTRPRVRTSPGAAQRGRKAVFVVRVADDRGEARMRLDLAYRNQLVFRAMTLLKPVRWSVRQRFDSRAPLSRSLQPGRYRVCVTAWDRTGNEARSCAVYRIR